MCILLAVIHVLTLLQLEDNYSLQLQQQIHSLRLRALHHPLHNHHCRQHLQLPTRQISMFLAVLLNNLQPRDQPPICVYLGITISRISHPQFFSKSPPSLSYPTGSTDENKNLHFIRSALGYLRSSSYVRDVLDWDPRPHPFYHLELLKQFVATQGFPDYTFDPSQTLATIHWVESKSPEFATELRKILNFGGTVSYGNIIEQIYHTVYS